MKALVKKKAAKGLWLEEVPTPKPGPNEVLIKVKKASICGTDVHIYKWDEWAQKTIPVPLTIGHEFTGQIVELGRNVEHLKIGDRISGEGHITCSICRNCRRENKHICVSTIGLGVQRNGCYAEYVTLPAENAFVLPSTIPDAIAAILDPLGNATHTALTYDLIGEDVLITGAGPIGCMAACIAQHVGARNVVITDIQEYRLNLARKMGVKVCVNTQKEDLRAVMKKLGILHGFDVLMEMSGAPAALASLPKLAMHGGGIAILGIPPKEVSLDWHDVIFKGLSLKGIYGRKMFETWYKMTALLQSGLDIHKVITHEFPKEGFEEAFQVMMSGESGKVILNWE